MDSSAELPVVWDEGYEVDIGPHVFPTRKYRLILELLMREGVVSSDQVRRPAPATDEDVALVHDREFVRQIRTGQFSEVELLRLEVPFSTELVSAMWLCAGGTHLTARLALEYGIAVHVGGGFHHAFSDHGEGFCLINDVAIAAQKLLDSGEVERLLIIDLDVHHGNGTAAIFSDERRVFTFSMHQTHNYPAAKPPSDLDLGLDDGVDDEEYLVRLDRALGDILGSGPFDLALYLAGADPYREDQLGGLGLTKNGLRRRDALTFAKCRGAGVPVAVTLAGGYAVNPEDTVEIHGNTIREAAKVLAG